MPGEFTLFGSTFFCWQLLVAGNRIRQFNEFADRLRPAHLFRVELNTERLFDSGDAFGPSQRIKPQINLQIHSWMNSYSLRRVLFDRFCNRLTGDRLHQRGVIFS